MPLHSSLPLAELADKGEGGLEELKTLLKDDSASFAYVRIVRSPSLPKARRRIVR